MHIKKARMLQKLYKLTTKIVIAYEHKSPDYRRGTKDPFSSPKLTSMPKAPLFLSISHIVKVFYS